ncbi:MAG: malate dehydrogenase [Deltaproteobacteria bacterium]|nr:malate dehydrogenase [Deltaproteobacteria bacterium]MBW2120498.1 malate dehydrogenase [Deltaproteobacteria bacterium]
MNKVSVIGSGNVGATTVKYLAEKGVADLVMIDVVEGMPIGKALDFVQSGPIRGYDVEITGSNDFASMRGSDVVVVTAGLPRKPGMSREDLLLKNASIMTSVSEKVALYAPNCVLIVVTNPLDVMCYVALKVTGFGLKKVVGMAGVLDSTRFCYFIAEELGVDPLDVTALVLGGHGDQMVPLPRYTAVSGVPVTQLLPRETIERLAERTRKGGAEIVSLLKKGSAFYAPAASVSEMVEAVVRDTKRILPCSAYLRGEYGLEDVYVGVPVKLGRDGVESIIELALTEEEMDALRASALVVRRNIEIWEKARRSGEIGEAV